MAKTIALNTSCEVASMICKYMGIPISGDTIIRILLKSMGIQPQCSEIVGVDDWAYKRRDNYGTLIYDAQTHKPIALLDGRDGGELKKWLEQNKHVKTVTRDRAGSYAKAIKDVLPNAIQVADRFHLYQNLLQAIKDAIGGLLPEKVEIKNTSVETEEIVTPEDTKKTEPSKQELTNYEECRKEFIIKVQNLYKEGYTKNQIVTMLKTTFKCVRKYLNGDPENLCISGRKNQSRGSKLDNYKENIYKMISEGKQYKEILSALRIEGYTGGYTILCEYCNSLRNTAGSKLARKKVNSIFLNILAK